MRARTAYIVPVAPNADEPSARTEEPCRSRHRLRLHPEDRTESSAPARHGIDRCHADLGPGELVQQCRHRADTVIALQQKSALALAELEPELPGGALERPAVVGNEIELPLAAAGKSRESEQIDAFLR